MPGSALNLGMRGASCVVSWPTRLVLCAPDRRAIFIPSTDCPRHNSVFVACRKSDHLQQLTDCPKDSLVFLACRKTCHTRVSNMDRDACTCRLKQHLGFAQPTNPLRLLTPRWPCDGIALRAFHREGGAAPDALAGGRQVGRRGPLFLTLETKGS